MFLAGLQMFNHKEYKRANGNHCVFFFNQRFKNTNIVPEFPQPHSPGLQLYKMHFTKETTVNLWWLNIWKINFLLFFIFESNGSRVSLGRAIFEWICIFFFSVLFSISLSFPIGKLLLYHLLSWKTMLFQRHVMCQKHLLDALTWLWIPAAT